LLEVVDTITLVKHLDAPVLRLAFQWIYWL
jgi:hypothetical protein